MICLLSCKTLPLGRIFFQGSSSVFSVTTSAVEVAFTRAGVCPPLAVHEFLWRGAWRRLWTKVWDLQPACEPQLIPCGCGLGQEGEHLCAGVTAGQLRRLWAGWACGTAWELARSPSPSAYTSSGCTDVPTQTKGKSISSGLFINTPRHEFFALLTRNYIPFIVVLGWACSWYTWKNPILHVCMWEAQAQSLNLIQRSYPNIPTTMKSKITIQS